MRLINADLLLEKYSTYCGEESCEKCKFIGKDRCNIYKTIDGTPTAFDVDNVAKRLKEASFPHEFGGEVQMMILENRAIEIIKEGGLNEH